MEAFCLYFFWVCPILSSMHTSKRAFLGGSFQYFLSAAGMEVKLHEETADASKSGITPDTSGE